MDHEPLAVGGGTPGRSRVGAIKGPEFARPADRAGPMGTMTRAPRTCLEVAGWTWLLLERRWAGRQS